MTVRVKGMLCVRLINKISHRSADIVTGLGERVAEKDVVVWILIFLTSAAAAAAAATTHSFQPG